MKVYIAAPYGALKKAHGLGVFLRSCGIDVTSRWHDDPFIAQSELTHEQMSRHAHQDTDDLDRSDAMVLMTGAGESTTGGCHFESGYAFASGLPVVVFGPPVNVFHHMDGWITVVPEHQGFWNLALTLKKIACA